MVCPGNSLKENHADEKARLRREFRARRAALDAAEWALMSAEITRRALAEPAVASSPAVFTYVSKGREAGTRALIVALRSRGKTIITPDSAGRGASPDVFIAAGTPPVPDRFISIDEVRRLAGVVIIPGIVWDAQGHRIGFGGGYFDHLLARLNPGALKIGLAFDFQIVERLPHDPWDIPADVIITESRRITADAASGGA